MELSRTEKIEWSNWVKRTPLGLYAETSTATEDYSSRWFATRSPSITFSSDSVSLSMYRFGSNVGTCFCGVDIES